MKKRMTSILLIAIIVLSNVIPASAILLPRETSPQINESSPAMGDAVAHTINLDVGNSSASNRVSSAKSQNSAQSHNIIAAEKAKKYVQSLNLSESGLGYIEDSCLAELDYYKTLEDTELTSYTVFTPSNSVALSSSSLPSNMYYYGTANNVTFYFYYPSAATINTNVVTLNSQSSLQKWVNNTVNIGMSFLQTEFSVVFASLNAIWGLPNGYQVHTNAYTEQKCNVDVRTRHIGAISNGTNKWIDLTTQQYGNVYPYITFNPVDTSRPGALTHDYGFQGQVFSPHYQLGTQTLCNEAWQVYMGAISFPDKLNLRSLTAFFK